MGCICGLIQLVQCPMASSWLDVAIQGRMQDFTFSGVEGTKWCAKCAAILAMPIFTPEKWFFLQISGLYTSYTEYSARRKY